MVISENHPESWDEETWIEHVVCVPTGYRPGRSGDMTESERVIAVRDPLAIARVRFIRGLGLPDADGISAVQQWPSTGENADGETLSVTSIETTPRFHGFDAWLEPAILRYAKQLGLSRVQIVVPVAIDHAKHYSASTKLQLVMWNEVPSELSHALMDEGFRPVSFREDPIGIDIAWQWDNDFR